MLLTIAANSIILGLTDFSDDKNITQWNQNLDKIDQAFTVLYTLEAILKIVAFGFIVHKKSYLKDPWNVLDFIVVIIGLISLIPSVPNLKFLRTMRVLRPLRSINAIPSMKRLVLTLLQSLPQIGYLTTFLLFFIYVFSILGMHLFDKNLYKRCRLTPEPVNGQWPIDFIQDRLCGGIYTCNENTYCHALYEAGINLDQDQVWNWTNIQYGFFTFDNIGSSMLSVFRLISLEGWTFVMYNYMDSTGYVAVFYFPITIIVGSFFVLNLFLAVMMETFSQQRQLQLSKEHILNKKKQIYDSAVTNMITLTKSKGELTKHKKFRNIGDAALIALDEQRCIQNEQTNQIIPADIEKNEGLDLKKNNQELTKAKKLRKFLVQICSSKYFTLLINLIIIANTISLGLDAYPVDYVLQHQLDTANLIFFSIFALEMIIKVIGLGPKTYIYDSYNIFDALVVTISIIDVTLSYSNVTSGKGAVSSFRAFRLVRVFKLAKFWTRLQRLIETVLISLVDIASFTVLMILLIFIYIILGMELFADQRNNVVIGNMDLHALRFNFNTFLDSFIVVFSVLSGQNWDTTMFSYAHRFGYLAIGYFVSLVFIGGMIFLNLFLAILLENFDLAIGSTQQAQDDSFMYQAFKVYQDHIKPFFVRIIAAIDNINNSTVSIGKMDENQSQQNLEAMNINSPLENQDLKIGAFSDWVDLQGTSRVQLANNREDNTLVPPIELLDQSDSINQYQSRRDYQKNNELESIQEIEEDPYLTKKSIDNLIKEAEDITPPRRLTEQYKKQTSVGVKFKNQESNSDLWAHKTNQFRKIHTFKQIQSEIFPELCNNRQSKMSLKSQSDQNQNKNPKIKRSKTKSLPLLIKEKLQSKNTIMAVTNNSVNPCEGNSLFLFNRNNKFRKRIAMLVQNKYFESFIFVLIVFSSILLALENPLHDPNGSEESALYYLDIILTFFFSMESIFKIISYGLLFNKSDSYLRNGWNFIDFSVVVLSIVSLVITSKKLKIVKILRLFRVLRPLRMISRNKGLKTGIQALLMAIPSLFNVVIISLFFLTIYGIIGVNYFKGAFYSCKFQANYIENIIIDQYTLVTTKIDCLNYGGDWLNADWNFDNVLQAASTLFQISTTEGWIEVLNNGVDSVGIDLQPRKNNNQYWAFYFMSFIILGNFLILNLFVGVVVQTFNKEKQILGKNFLLSKKQKKWLDQKKLCMSIKPKLIIRKDTGFIRFQVNRLVSSHKFEVFILFTIIINSIILAINWYNQTKDTHTALLGVNYAFAIIFTLEAILKLIAYGPAQYFSNQENLFDFSVVVGQVVSTAISISLNIDFGAAGNFIRALKLSKIFKYFKQARQIQVMFETFLVTIPALTNIGGLLLLFLYIFSVLGVFLFAEVQLQSNLDVHANFQSFGYAFLTLLRCTTGETWDYIMNDLLRQRSIQFQCSNDFFDYQVYKANGFNTVGCGSPSAIIFFYGYFLMVPLIFLNLFIAIILEGYALANQSQHDLVPKEELTKFAKIWAKFDPNATGFINIVDFPSFMQLLGEPLGWDQQYQDDQKLQDKFLEELNITTYNNFKSFLFWDVMQALTKIYMVKVELEKSKQKVANVESNFFTNQSDEEESEESELSDIKQKEKQAEKRKLQIRLELEFEQIDGERKEVLDVEELRRKEQKIKKNYEFKRDTQFTSAHIRAARKIVQTLQQIRKKREHQISLELKRRLNQRESRVEAQSHTLSDVQNRNLNATNFNTNSEQRPTLYIRDASVDPMQTIEDDCYVEKQPNHPPSSF